MATAGKGLEKLVWDACRVYRQNGWALLDRIHDGSVAGQGKVSYAHRVFGDFYGIGLDRAPILVECKSRQSIMETAGGKRRESINLVSLMRNDDQYNTMMEWYRRYGGECYLVVESDEGAKKRYYVFLGPVLSVGRIQCNMAEDYYEVGFVTDKLDGKIVRYLDFLGLGEANE